MIHQCVLFWAAQQNQNAILLHKKACKCGVCLLYCVETECAAVFFSGDRCLLTAIDIVDADMSLALAQAVIFYGLYDTVFYVYLYD
jgi:hypothetical protein